MSAVSSSRSRSQFLLIGVLAATLITGIVGCGGDEEVDPYVYTTLRAATRGDTLSVDNLYEIEAPQFEFVRGNTAVVRDGNLLEFVVATNLEQTYTQYAGALLGVQKFYSPSPHMMIKRLKKAGVATPVDSCTSFIIPKMLPVGAIDLETPGAPLPDLEWDKKDGILDYIAEEGNDPISVQTGFERFVYAPRHDLPDSVKANPTDEDMAWYTVAEESTFEISNVHPGAEYMLHLLLEKDLPLIGCFTVLECEMDYPTRKIDHEILGHVSGKIQVNWFKYANGFVKGTTE